MNEKAIARGILIASCLAAFFLLVAGCHTEGSHEASVERLKEDTAPSRSAPRFEFTRMIAHWSGYANTGYLAFVEDARPEVAQVGFYGAHFWSLADTAFGGGYPANLPVRGHRECG